MSAQSAALMPPARLYGPTSASAPLATQTGKTLAPCAGAEVLEIRFRVHDEHAPALRSAVEELVNEVGGRLEGMHSYAQEQALTDAAVALGALKTAVFKQVPAGDPHYKTHRRQ